MVNIIRMHYLVPNLRYVMCVCCHIFDIFSPDNSPYGHFPAHFCRQGTLTSPYSQFVSVTPLTVKNSRNSTVIKPKFTRL